MQLSAHVLAVLSVVVASLACTAPAPADDDPRRAASPEREWRTHGGNPGHTQHSPLAAINRGNVSRLQLAWTYHTGDARGEVA